MSSLKLSISLLKWNLSIISVMRVDRDKMGLMRVYLPMNQINVGKNMDPERKRNIIQVIIGHVERVTYMDLIRKTLAHVLLLVTVMWTLPWKKALFNAGIRKICGKLDFSFFYYYSILSKKIHSIKIEVIKGFPNWNFRLQLECQVTIRKASSWRCWIWPD